MKLREKLRTITKPLVLQITASGNPQRWIPMEKAVSYYVRDKVLFELGSTVGNVVGGYNRLSGIQSIISPSSIIAIKSNFDENALFHQTPILNNKLLFARDRNVCAYCGDIFQFSKLSRDHIVPRVQGGPNTWMNVVTACKDCNAKKGGKTPEQAHMELLYAPYIPDRYESFILSRSSRVILEDQMEYLLSKVSKKSRLLVAV